MHCTSVNQDQKKKKVWLNFKKTIEHCERIIIFSINFNKTLK